jgi:ATP-dependent DNA helicase PIF1
VRDGLNLDIVLKLGVLVIPSDINMHLKLKRGQFNVRLAFSVTIKKSQGEFSDKICLYLPKPVLSHTQQHIALSKCLT